MKSMFELALYEYSEEPAGLKMHRCQKKSQDMHCYQAARFRKKQT